MTAVATRAAVPAKAHRPGEIMETVLIKGDLSKLTPDERNVYYFKLCESVGLNPLTQPIEYINLNGKLRLYAKKDCTDQLRAIHKVSVTDMTETEREGVYIVKSKVQNGDGRTDMAIGAVNIAGLKGEALANAMMKAETKSKRRATLSICGLGILDETEVEDIPRAQVRVPSPAEVEHVQTDPKKAQHHKPYSIVPEANDTLQMWADRYVGNMEGSVSKDELDAWEKLNRRPLATIAQKSPKLHTQIVERFNGMRDVLMRNSISTGPAQEVVPPAPTELARPEGCPNAELEPDAFVAWASRKMARLTTTEELDLIWENEIEAFMDGLFKPDCDALQAQYETHKKRLGGD